MKKRILCSVVALSMLITLLAACGGGSNGASIENPVSQQVTDAGQTTGSAAAEATPESEPQPEPTTWLTEQPITLTCWYTWPAFFNNFDSEVQGPQDTDMFKIVKGITNVEVDFRLANTESAKELFGLMVASGDYPDLIYGVNENYTGGTDAAIEDEVILDLRDMIPQYAPNFYSYLSGNKDIAKGLISDVGNMAGFPIIYKDELVGRGGYLIRNDWLKDLGLAMPQNLDDLYSVLSAFKTEKDCYAPMCIVSDGKCGAVATAVGLTDSMYYVEDGVVKYGVDKMKDYFTYMNRLYDEALVPIDFMSYNESQEPPSSLTLTGGTGVFNTELGKIDNLREQSQDPNADLVAMPALSPAPGRLPYLSSVPERVELTNYISVSTACKYPEVAVQYMDYFYSEEGFILSNYGVEGVTFEYGPDGTPVLSEKITNNPDVPTVIAGFLYINPCFPHLRLFTRDFYSYSDVAREAHKVWTTVGEDTYADYPQLVSYTDAETNVLARYQTDLQTYFDENYLRFMTGELSIGKDFDDFLSTLQKNFNMDELLAVKQAAYDRYMAR